MDTRFIENFVRVVDSGSMAEAARRAGVTPAAIAQQIQTLERELGTPLLVRAGRTVIPTDAGHRVVTKARHLVRDVSAFKASALADDLRGELRIGTITTALLSLLPDVLARFAAAFPNAKVWIRAGTSNELYEAMQRGELDIAICLHPPFSLAKSYEWHQLREEAIVVLAPQRLAHLPAHDLLVAQPFIRYDRELGGGKQADRYLREHGIVPHELFELNSLAAIALMVDRGLGVSLVPNVASPLTAALRIARIPLPHAPSPRRFGLLWQRASPRARLISGLQQCADEVRDIESQKTMST